MKGTLSIILPPSFCQHRLLGVPDATSTVSVDLSPGRAEFGHNSATARGDRFQIHVDSAPISGNIIMVTRRSIQSVTIDTIGTEDKISATITLHRGSR